jgi:AcrR family transcriptional regulator
MPTKKPVCKGRPAEIDRNDLLDAAEKLFAEKGFFGTTTREVVKKAKCNLALISYYFGGKEGLYQAVLMRHFGRAEASYAKIDFSAKVLAKEWPELPNEVQRRFCAMMFELSRKVTSSSPVQKILCREMMTGAAKMAEALTKTEGSAYSLLTRFLTSLQKEGALSRDFDTRYAIVGLIGPVVYSCIAGPILKSTYGFADVDGDYIRGLCLHQTRTFFKGWGAK